MTRLSLGPLTVDADIEATRGLYESLESPDPQCCNACATFLLMLERDKLPADLQRFMSDAGITPTKPVETWGAPDGGFLQVWWEFIGRSVGADAGGDTQMFELESGIRYRVTEHHPPSDWAVERGQRLPALEVTWEHDAIRYLESDAWPGWLHGEGDPEVGA